MATVAPESEVMSRERFDPIVLATEYEYSSCFMPPCYCCTFLAANSWFCVPFICCFANPDKSLAWTHHNAKSASLFNGPLLSYRFDHTPKGYKAAEIFRNAAAGESMSDERSIIDGCRSPNDRSADAIRRQLTMRATESESKVDEYHRWASQTGCVGRPCGLPACQMISLAFRATEIDGKCYGNDEERRKVTFDYDLVAGPLKKKEKGVEKGALLPLPGDGSRAALEAEFGAFHFGWADTAAGDAVASLEEPAPGP